MNQSEISFSKISKDFKIVNELSRAIAKAY